MYHSILARLPQLFGRMRHILGSTTAGNRLECQLEAQPGAVLVEGELLKSIGIACGGPQGLWIVARRAILRREFEPEIEECSLGADTAD